MVRIRLGDKADTFELILRTYSNSHSFINSVVLIVLVEWITILNLLNKGQGQNLGKSRLYRIRVNFALHKFNWDEWSTLDCSTTMIPCLLMKI